MRKFEERELVFGFFAFLWIITFHFNLSFCDGVDVIQTTSELLLQVLRDAESHEFRAIEFDLLVNHLWIQHILDFNGAVLEVPYYVGSSKLCFQDNIRPLYLFEI